MSLSPRHRIPSSASIGFGLFALWLFSAPSFAVDGVIEINQARALAGGVTPGDAAGFPVTLSLPGSYRLTSNLTVDENTTAIEISSGHLSIDLNGFEISGPNACSTTSFTPPLNINCTLSGTGIGISAPNPFDDISIRNGGIRGMGNRGVSLNPSYQHHLENLSVSHNGDRGISAGNGVYRGNKVILNKGYGILGDDGIYSDNFVGFNDIDGINGKNAVFSGNTSSHNGASGIRGGGISGSFIANIVGQNSGDGIKGADGTYVNNTANSNVGDGIDGVDGTYSGNTANNNNGYGINGRVGSFIGNTAAGNTKEGISLNGISGYAQNVLAGNNGGGAQVVGGGFELGTNVCHLDTICP